MGTGQSGRVDTAQRLGQSVKKYGNDVCINREEVSDVRELNLSHGRGGGGRDEGEEEDSHIRSDISIEGDSSVSDNRIQEHNYCDEEDSDSDYAPITQVLGTALYASSYPVLLSLHGMGSSATSQVRR